MLTSKSGNFRLGILKLIKYLWHISILEACQTGRQLKKTCTVLFIKIAITTYKNHPYEAMLNKLKSLIVAESKDEILVSQCLSTSLNVPQYISTYFHVSQCLSISHNVSQLSQNLTMSLNILQCLPMSLNLSQSLSIDFNLSQYLSMTLADAWWCLMIFDYDGWTTVVVKHYRG